MHGLTAREKSISTFGPREGLWLVLWLNPKKHGSQEQQLLALAERMATRGTPLTYVFSAEPPAWFRRELERWRVDVRWQDWRRPWRAAARLAIALAQARPALVHFHFFRASSPLVLAARATGARVMVNDHVTLTPGSRAPHVRALKRLRDAAVNPLVDVRLAVSRFVAESVARCEHVPRARIAVVENGVDTARFANASGAGVREELELGARPLIVCVSRLAGEKGVRTAVEATARIGREAVLALVGDGPLAGELRALAAQLGVADRVKLLGLRQDVERLIAACDVSIVPSEWDEAFGQAVTESMAAGKPVVVTRSGAMPEIVEETGLVVPKRDPAALAAAVNRLLSDGPLRERLGSAARARARECFDLSRWVSRMTALYEQFLPPARRESVTIRAWSC
jgi:glycosyltransferase involved in cell wall biosynthesis